MAMEREARDEWELKKKGRILISFIKRFDVKSNIRAAEELQRRLNIGTIRQNVFLV